MSRDHHWRWRSFDPDVEPDVARPEDQGSAKVYELGAFVEHRPPWLGPSPDSHLMQPVRRRPAPVERVVRPRTTRPDARIREDVCEAMTHDGWLDATAIDVEVKNGQVTLTGLVVDREQKWRAEDHAEHALGVSSVVNRIRVQKDTARDEDRAPPAVARGDGPGQPRRN